jgi:putative ABC transport system permease protein
MGITMDIVESIRLAMRGLSANKLRSGLTMLGIIIGVGAVIALLSIGQGAQKAITEQIQGIGSNLIFIIPGSLTQGGASFGLGSLASLTMEDAEAIADPANCPDVAAVAPQQTRNAQIIYRNRNTNASVVGTTPEFAFIRRLELDQGHFFDEQDLASAARVAVLGGRLAIDLFETESAVGQTIRINRIPFRVIGVLVEQGGGGTIDTSVFVPITSAKTRLFGTVTARGGGSAVSLINASAVSEDRIDAAIEQITALLRQRHRIQYQQDDFTVTSQKDILGVLNQVTDILTIFLGAIAAISLLVGGIGIMNIMLVSVTERTREIGIRKAVGAKRRDIMVQFLIEAMVLSIIGGVIGIGFGALAAAAVNSTGVLVTRVSLQAVVLAVAFSLAVGLFFGLYPATRAASLNPIEALRYE